jgi:hypothetical protein
MQTGDCRRLHNSSGLLWASAMSLREVRNFF